jgi:uncharacterized membrane protein
MVQLRSVKSPTLPATFALAFALAFGLRLFNIHAESLWRDEIDVIRFAFAPTDELIRSFTRNGFNGPLYMLLMRLWLSLSGVSDFALRYFSTLCGVALVAAVFVVARRLAGRRTAIIAAWLITISPVHIWYSTEGKMYTLQPLLLVLALYALLRVVVPGFWVDGNWRANLKTSQPAHLKLWPWWLLFVVATSLAFYTHLLAPIFLIVAVAVFLAWWPRVRQHKKGAVIALACLTLPYLPLAAWQLPKLLQGFNSGHAFYPLNIMALSLLSDWTYGFGTNAPLFFVLQPNWVRACCVALLVAVATLGLMRIAAHSRPAALSLLAWLMLPALIVFFVSLRAPIFEPRYLLWCAPALYILAAAGIASEGNGKWEMGQARPTPFSLFPHPLLALLTLISLLGFGAQVAQPIRPDLRGAAAYIQQNLQPGDALVFQIPYGRYGFEYYLRVVPNLKAQVSIVEAPFTNYGMHADEVAAFFRQQLVQNRRVWLVETEAALWDARGLVRAWFDTAKPLIERQDFFGVQVGLYDWR